MRRLLTFLLYLLLKDWPLQIEDENKCISNHNTTQSISIIKTNIIFYLITHNCLVLFLFVSILEVKINYSTSPRPKGRFDFCFPFLFIFTMENPKRNQQRWEANFPFHRAPERLIETSQNFCVTSKKKRIKHKFFTCCSNFWFRELIVNFFFVLTLVKLLITNRFFGLCTLCLII